MYVPARGRRPARSALGVCSVRAVCMSGPRQEALGSEVEATPGDEPRACHGRRALGLEVLVQSEVFGRPLCDAVYAQQVHDKATLLAHICKHPLGINETSSSMQYAALFRDLESLQADNKVVVLRGRWSAAACFQFR